MADFLDISPYQAVAYPHVSDNFLERLLEETATLQAKGQITLDPEILRYLATVRRLSEMSPIQARMPEIIIR